MSSSDEGASENLDLFNEPEGFFQEKKEPTTIVHKTLNGEQLSLRLVGYSPLWAHHLWNAGLVLANHLETHPELVRSKTILELGAGAGLPSLIAALCGAKSVVITDYPDAELISNLNHNISENAAALRSSYNVRAQGYLWGAPTEDLLVHTPAGFDVLILGDLLFNHSEHAKLVRTVQLSLSRTRDAVALVFFTPYRPWLLTADLAFFELAREGGFVIEQVCESIMEEVMFEEDPGDEKLRRTVFGYEMRWKDVS